MRIIISLCDMRMIISPGDMRVVTSLCAMNIIMSFGHMRTRATSSMLADAIIIIAACTTWRTPGAGSIASRGSARPASTTRRQA